MYLVLQSDCMFFVLLCCVNFNMNMNMTLRVSALADFFRFLENVNSGSRSLYVIARPSVCRFSSGTFVHPTKAIEIFGNVSRPFGTLPWTPIDIQVKVYGDRPRETPPSGKLNT